MPAQSKSPYYFKSGWRRSGCSQFAKHDDIARYCEELATKTKACEAQILSLTKELQRANTQLARLEEERFEFAFENEKAALVCSKTFMTLPMPAFDGPEDSSSRATWSDDSGFIIVRDATDGEPEAEAPQGTRR